MRPETERAQDRRRQRLIVLLWFAPGPALVVAGVNLWANPWLLAGGLAWCGLALIRMRGRARQSLQTSLVDPIAQEIDP